MLNHDNHHVHVARAYSYIQSNQETWRNACVPWPSRDYGTMYMNDRSNDRSSGYWIFRSMPVWELFGSGTDT